MGCNEDVKRLEKWMPRVVEEYVPYVLIQSLDLPGAEELLEAECVSSWIK